MSKLPDITNYNHTEILSLSLRLQKVWKQSAIIWTIMDYAFTILSFITSVIVIFLQASDISQNLITVYTVAFTSISSTFVVVSFCVNPRKHKMVYRKAFDILNSAVLATYLSNDDSVYENLVASIINGERIIATSIEVDVCNENETIIADKGQKSCKQKRIDRLPVDRQAAHQVLSQDPNSADRCEPDNL